MIIVRTKSHLGKYVSFHRTLLLLLFVLLFNPKFYIAANDHVDRSSQANQFAITPAQTNTSIFATSWLFNTTQIKQNETFQIGINVKDNSSNSNIGGAEVSLSLSKGVWVGWEVPSIADFTDLDGNLILEADFRLTLFQDQFENVTISVTIQQDGYQNKSDEFVVRVERTGALSEIIVEGDSLFIEPTQNVTLQITILYQFNPVSNVMVNVNATSGSFGNGESNISLITSQYGDLFLNWSSKNVDVVFEAVFVNISISLVDDIYISDPMEITITISPTMMSDDSMYNDVDPIDFGTKQAELTNEDYLLIGLMNFIALVLGILVTIVTIQVRKKF